MLKRIRLPHLLLSSLIWGLTSSSLQSQESPWISSPDTLLPKLIEAAEFWKGTYDETYGGFFTHINRQGEVTDLNAKYLLTQSRNSYAMIKAFQITGDLSYLDYARGGLDFQLEHGVDAATGGWYEWVLRDGSLPAGQSNGRWASFRQHYLLLGLGHMLEAAPNERYAKAFQDGLMANEALLWDERPGLEGYFNEASSDGALGYNKGFTPTVDAVTTHALQRVLLGDGASAEDRLAELGNQMVRHLAGSMTAPGVALGFPELYDNDWNVSRGQTWALVGHLVKTAWCLGRIYQVRQEPVFRETMQQLLDYSLETNPTGRASMWDPVNGGHYFVYFPFSGTLTKDKGWWTVQQSIMSGLMAYAITGEQRYLDAASMSMNFWMDHLWDWEYGDCYDLVDEDGSNPNLSYKGDHLKAGYHTVELLYLAYLYAKLFVHQEPVQLYYSFQAKEGVARLYPLRPLAIREEELHITEVQRNGEIWSGLFPEERLIVVPGDEDAVYKVTFARPDSSHVQKWPFETATDTAGWRNAWFGMVYLPDAGTSWFYHLDLGWMQGGTIANDPGYWLYAISEPGFYYSSRDIWPYVYSWKQSRWGLIQDGGFHGLDWQAGN